MKTWRQPGTEQRDSDEELAAMVCQAVAPLLNPSVCGQQRGLYLATSDAGISRAVQFWADALAETPRFASPAGFPWTLANSPAALIARELDIRGPNHTNVGEQEALDAAMAQGRSDLQSGRIREALVVTMNLGADCQAQALLLDG